MPKTAVRSILITSFLVTSFLVPAPPLAAQDSVRAAESRAASEPNLEPRTANPESRTPRGDARVCAGGDVTFGTDLDTGWVARMIRITGDSATAFQSPDVLVAPLRPLVTGADIVVLNEEGAIGDGPVDDPKCSPQRKHCFALRSPPTAALALRSVADTPTVVVANLANNHSHDAGAAGFQTTQRLLDSAGVRVTGADTEPTLAVTPHGDTIAILGLSAWSDPGVQDTAAVRRLVSRASARYGRVIVTAHLGAEGRLAQRTADSVEVYVGENRGNAIAFAHTAVDAGAALVIGHGPHALRAAEWRNGSLIWYSIGNLINYGPFGLEGPLDRGAVVCATLDSVGRLRDVMLTPTRQRLPGRLEVDETARARVLVDSLSRLDFPLTGAAVDRSTGAVWERPPVPLARPTGPPIRRRPARSAAPTPGSPSSSPRAASPAAHHAKASPRAQAGDRAAFR